MSLDVKLIGLEEINDWEALEQFEEIIEDFKRMYTKIYLMKRSFNIAIKATAIFRIDLYTRKFSFVEFDGEHHQSSHEQTMRDHRMKWFF